MTVSFCNEKIDAEYASLCIKMIRKPSRKKALLKFLGSRCNRRPGFRNFRQTAFPVNRNIPASMTLAQVSTSNIYMWYPYILVEKTVEILNYLHSQAVRGEQIFYNIYSPDEMEADPTKADTGIFVFKGDAGKPFAITNAGGGFAYVGAMHDSFPHSLELCRAGYTAFALIYRPDDPYSDLARAISFITETDLIRQMTTTNEA